MAGLALRIQHPELPECESCQRWLYDDQWRQTKRGSNPVSRPPGTKPPCWKCPKTAGLPLERRTPEYATNLSERNLRAYWYYRRCLVDGGQFSRDPLVIRNNALIQELLDQIDRQALQSAAGVIPALLTVLTNHQSPRR